MSELANTTIPPGPIRLTYQDYCVLPEDGKRYEIITGELVVTPSPTPRHQGISGALFRFLYEWADRQGGKLFAAPIDVLLDNQTVVQPDILLIRKENLGAIGEKYIQGPPDLVVEILSPATRRNDILVKSQLYARFGVPWYWIVDPDIDRIEAFRLSQGTYSLFKTAVSPQTMAVDYFNGLAIPLDKVFA